MNLIRYNILFTLVLVIKVNSVPINNYNEVIDYLKTFGYLSDAEKTSLNNIIDNEQKLHHDKRFKRALSNLQRNGNIPITGEYDKSTIALIRTPRCGVSDKVLNVKRHKRYTLMSSKWHKTDLTWSFNAKNDEFAKEETNIKRIIGEALSVWETDTIMTFKEVTIDENPDILISFLSARHYDVDPYIFGTQTLAHAFQPGKGIGGDAHFNKDVYWDFEVSYDSEPANGKISFYAVALHELGHSLGLGHTRDEKAVMYEYYSKSTSTLAEDDIRGMHSIYGAPPNKNYKPPPKKEESEEDMPIWDKKVILPNKCNTSYDAIAMIDKKLIAFKGKYMFGPDFDPIEIRSRWSDLPETLTHVDAVHQTSDGNVLFFIDTQVYIFLSDKLQFTRRLNLMGIDTSVTKVDVVFKFAYNMQTFIFSGHNYWKLEEKTLSVDKGFPKRISGAFKDVYDIDTGFTYDDVLYFFKNEYYYEFDDKPMRMKRMRPALSASFFMKCKVPTEETNQIVSFNNRFGEKDNNDRDYIDLGEIPEEEDKSNEVKQYAKLKDDKGSASSIKSILNLIIVIALTVSFI